MTHIDIPIEDRAWSVAYAADPYLVFDSEKFSFDFHHDFSRNYSSLDLHPYDRYANDAISLVSLRKWISNFTGAEPIDACRKAEELPWLAATKEFILSRGSTTLGFPHVPAGVYLDLLRYFDPNKQLLADFLDGVSLIGFIFRAETHSLDKPSFRHLAKLVKSVFKNVPKINGKHASIHYNSIIAYEFSELSEEEILKFSFKGGPIHQHSDIPSDNVEVYSTSHGRVDSLSQQVKDDKISSLPFKGQLKIFESMSSFLTESLTRNSSLSKCVILGSAPGMSYDALQSLFPSVKFLVVDPYPSVYPSTFVVWDWTADPVSFLRQFLGDSFFVFYSDVNFNNGITTTTGDIMNLTDQYLHHCKDIANLVGLCEKAPCDWSSSKTSVRFSSELHYQAFHSGTETRMWTFNNFFDRGSVRSESLESSIDYYRVVTCNRHVKHGRGISLFDCYCHSCCKLSMTIRRSVETAGPLFRLDKFKKKFHRLYRSKRPLYTSPDVLGTIGHLFYTETCLLGRDRSLDLFQTFVSHHSRYVEMSYSEGAYWISSKCDSGKFNLTVQLAAELDNLQDSSPLGMECVKIHTMHDDSKAIAPRHYFNEQGLHVQVGFRGWTLFSGVQFYSQQYVLCNNCSDGSFPYSIWYPHYVAQSYTCGCSNFGVVSTISLPL